MTRVKGALVRGVIVLAIGFSVGVLSGFRGVQPAEARRCTQWGRGCQSSSQCCRPLFCGFDGYTRYCRY
jgi:hypothetical protein